jgi:hypothetical protein
MLNCYQKNLENPYSKSMISWVVTPWILLTYANCSKEHVASIFMCNSPEGNANLHCHENLKSYKCRKLTALFLCFLMVHFFLNSYYINIFPNFVSQKKLILDVEFWNDRHDNKHYFKKYQDYTFTLCQCNPFELKALVKRGWNSECLETINDSLANTCHWAWKDDSHTQQRVWHNNIRMLALLWDNKEITSRNDMKA